MRHSWLPKHCLLLPAENFPWEVCFFSNLRSIFGLKSYRHSVTSTQLTIWVSNEFKFKKTKCHRNVKENIQLHAHSFVKWSLECHNVIGIGLLVILSYVTVSRKFFFLSPKMKMGKKKFKKVQLSYVFETIGREKKLLKH